MSGTIRVISDPHLMHENMAKRRGFKNSECHDENFIYQWNNVVNKKDTTYILGDITMEKKKGYELLSRLNGYIFVILGNHDRRQDVKELLKYVDGVAGMVNMKGCILTHCPVHPVELNYRFKYNIHGHVHENSITKLEWDHLNKCDKVVFDKRYINVCCEAVDYIPRVIDDLITT